MAEFAVRDAGDGRHEVAASGEVDIESVERLLEVSRECLDASPQVLALDLAGVTFIDSSGLGALVRIRKAADARNADLVLQNVPGSVHRLLEVTGLSEVFTTSPSG